VANGSNEAILPVSSGEIVAHKYRVERAVGVGAMGVVVSARHTTLDQVVAIKFLAPQSTTFTSRDEAIARFLAEARAAARIESDHVCRVFDVGTQPNGTPYMVMEYLEGRDLEDELQLRGQLDLVEAADYILQAADAIAAAHQLGIVHRDLKPANLFLATRPDGSRRVKVLDFGISKANAGPRITREAGSLGTPAYMSPEQVRDPMTVDHRTDIWALGAILYELVTGEMAFVGSDVKTILDNVVGHDPCPMNALRRDVTPELESIVMRCLDRDRERRWASAALFARALSAFGSVGIIAQLASVQREIGSISSVRLAAAPSVEPMVANVRPHVITQPDLEEESRLRGAVREDWNQRQTRKRRARAAVIGLVTAGIFSVTAAVILNVAARTRARGVASSAAEPLPPASTTASHAPATADQDRAEPAPQPASSQAPPPVSVAKNVYAAPSSVQSARTAGPRPAPAVPKPAIKPSPKASVDRLTETRD
jgi:eukaryotic-like serine/threonine-protein kinase